jgi:hypothetical protein
MKYYDPSIEEDVLTLFNEVVVETYQRFGININTDFSLLQMYMREVHNWEEDKSYQNGVVKIPKQKSKNKSRIFYIFLYSYAC